jgi:hypothetical protein
MDPVLLIIRRMVHIGHNQCFSIVKTFPLKRKATR